MGDEELEPGHRGEVPDLYPPPAEQFKQYATAGEVFFGWLPTRDGDGVRFFVSKYRWMGGVSTLGTWPVSDDGWAAAWQYVQAEQPALADAIVKVWRKGLAAREAARQLAERRAPLELEGSLDLLSGCVLLGGYGLDDGISPAGRVDLHLTQRGIWLTKAGRYEPYLRRDYEHCRTIEFEGGAVRKGGGYVGGGFGLLGAAEGMAMSALLNSLTIKTQIHTTIRIEADEAEVFLFTDRATPRDLEIRLAEARARINAPASIASGSSLSDSDLAGQLVRLGEMVDKGYLTAEEFATAKAQLFARSS